MQEISKNIKNKQSYIIGAISILVLLSLNVPWLPTHFKYSIDSSWLFVLHESTFRDWQFGADLIWHYGPLGFVYAKYYHPETYDYMLAFYVFVSMVFAWLSYSTIIHSSDKPNYIAIVAVSLIASFTHESMFLVLPFAFYLYSFLVPKDKQQKTLLGLVFFTLILLSHVKITFLVASFAVFAIMDFARLLNKKVPRYLPIGIALFCVVWFLLGQDPTNIPSFIAGALEHSSGFVVAMPIYRDFTIPAVLFSTAMLLVGSQMAYVWLTKYGKPALGPLIALCILFVLLNKMAFSHPNDSHRLESFAAFLLLILLMRDFFFCDIPNWSKNTLGIFAALVVSVIVMGMMISDDRKDEVKDAISISQSFISDDLDIGKELSSRFDSRAIYDSKIKEITDRTPLDDIEGSVDLYSTVQILLMANEVNYTPRPIFQSYHVYTQKFAEINKKHLEENAPENILFNVYSLLDRFAQLDDAISQPVILSSYDFVSMRNEYAHFKKRPEQKDYEFINISGGKFKIEKSIKVPEIREFGPVWAKLIFEDSFIGKLAKLVFRSSPLPIEIEYVSGKKEVHWFIPNVSKLGFIISPVINDATDFVAIAQKNIEYSKLKEVKSIKVDLENYPLISWLYKPDVEFRFSYLLIE